METRQRTVVKALLWNLLGLTAMSVVGLVFTGSFAIGGAMAGANAAIGLVSYILYERAWQLVHWGRHG